MFNNSLSINKTYFLKYLDRGILENIAQSAFYKGMTIVGQLLLIPLSVKILSKETFGIWITISTIINWLTFFDIGFNNGLRHKLVESIASGDTVLSKRYIATSYFYITAICFVIGCAYVILSFSLDLQTLLFSKTERSQQVILSLGLAFGLFLIRFVLMTINYINLATQNSSKNDLIQFITISLTLAALYIFKAVRTLDLIDVVLIFSIIPIVVYMAYSIYFFYKNSSFRLSI
ncbi:MAG TPA: hypothetical protein VLJ41_00030, partial [Segetibacter sp.]|nr:hypothetical protein [Segetibacter sp.]